MRLNVTCGIMSQLNYCLELMVTDQFITRLMWATAQMNVNNVSDEKYFGGGASNGLFIAVGALRT